MHFFPYLEFVSLICLIPHHKNIFSKKKKTNYDSIRTGFGIKWKRYQRFFQHRPCATETCCRSSMREGVSAGKLRPPSLTNVTHLCGEGASGWKAQISPSSTPCRLPLTVAGTPKGNFPQTTLGAGRRTVWRFQPRSQNKKRIWIPEPSCWTGCLTVDQFDRCRVGDGDHRRILCQGPDIKLALLLPCWRVCLIQGVVYSPTNGPADTAALLPPLHRNGK